MLVRGGIRGGRLLSPKIKLLWFLEITPLLVGLLVLAYLFFYHLLPLTGFHDEHSLIALLVSSLGLVLSSFIFIEIKYKKWVYSFDEKEFIIKKGIFEKLRYIIPYEKIQNVSVSRNPAELIFGLGTIHIETAATVPAESDLLLPGIEEYHDVVNELIGHSQKEKKGNSEEIHHIKMIQELHSIYERLGALTELLAKQHAQKQKNQFDYPSLSSYKKQILSHTNPLIESEQMR